MSAKQTNANITAAATGIAGGALVSNAIHGHDKENMAWSIIFMYVIFGGVIGTFKYLSNALRWLRYEGVKTSSRVQHIVLPPLSLLGGILGWKIGVAAGQTNGLIVLGVALTFQLALAVWCFNRLTAVNAAEGKVDQVGFGSASFLYIGAAYLSAVIWSIFALGAMQ